MKRISQQGVGLIEVLVALVILALGVLGFSALQLRAMDAAQEATEQSVAINTARDLAERMRVNRTALGDYEAAVNAKTTDETGCINTNELEDKSANKFAVPLCSPTVMAEHDATEVLAKARNQGQTIIVANCIGSSLNCIYVAWGDTTITATNVSQCVNTITGVYVAGAKCLVMEAF
ncbi:type IV pilus modification protein PilV [Acinetobacter higginsii]|uniref:type IV pilus modification protein PilV n=1 Tax=Acinetobacter higginsii TaxID=70347 RepID=UPI001F4A4B3B|nr:type IV pilus modification protein PilV [Acinetobacter higginsii]MCH7305981.1 type IV pilus modification protein PilV [Acinetobacter higginsii]MCH7338990.1 type IV pilus modification protein PilV [Acinetobacter higginsii]